MTQTPKALRFLFVTAVLTGTACGGPMGSEAVAGDGEALGSQAQAVTATLSCVQSGGSVNCTGSATSGTAPFVALWSWYLQDLSTGEELDNTGWYQGGFSASYACSPYRSGATPGYLRVSFKVRDANGMESSVAGKSFGCSL